AVDAQSVAAVWGVEGNVTVEPVACKSFCVGVAFEWAIAAREDVGHDAGGERDDVADDAGQRQSEQAERGSRAVASERGRQAEQILPGGRMLLRLRFFRGGRGLPGLGVVAHRKLDRAVLRDGASFRKWSYGGAGGWGR